MPWQEGVSGRFLLVEERLLPEVFCRVLEAKELLASGKAETAAQAARQAGISRSAYYKYKDAVFAYEQGRVTRLLTVHLLLHDRPGVLSTVLTTFADAGANILTVNQNIPAGGAASVSVSARVERLSVTEEQFLARLRHLSGVTKVQSAIFSDG